MKIISGRNEGIWNAGISVAEAAVCIEALSGGRELNITYSLDGTGGLGFIDLEIT